MNAVLSWLAPRAASVKSLRMRGSARDLDEDFEQVSRQLASMSDDAINSHCCRPLLGMLAVQKRCLAILLQCKGSWAGRSNVDITPSHTGGRGHTTSTRLALGKGCLLRQKTQPGCM